jgi:hypothetical protein
LWLCESWEFVGEEEKLKIFPPRRSKPNTTTTRKEGVLNPAVCAFLTETIYAAPACLETFSVKRG